MDEIILGIKGKKIKHKKLGFGIIKSVEYRDGKYYLNIEFETDKKEKVFIFDNNYQIYFDFLDKDIIKYISKQEELKKIHNYLIYNDIQYLIHFTNKNNLKYILQYGLLSKNELDNKKITYKSTDDNYRDDYRDNIFLSISFPNYRMLFPKTNANPTEELVILKIDAKIIEEKFRKKEVMFVPENSAIARVRNDIKENKEKFETFEAFENLFKDIKYKNEIKIRNEDLENKYTTNPEAEVLIKNRIELDDICTVVAKDNSQKERLKKIVGDNISVITDSTLYRPRQDYRDWQENNVHECITF